MYLKFLFYLTFAIGAMIIRHARDDSKIVIFIESFWITFLKKQILFFSLTNLFLDTVQCRHVFSTSTPP